MDLESAVMEIILSSGRARSCSYEALSKAKAGNYEGAEEIMAHAREAAKVAHRIQTQLIEEDQSKGKNPMTLVTVHAQDHLMTSMLAQEMVQELITLHKKVDQKQ
ncbi:PTS lactose/cellobiose transporter subunit IIA [Endozoicomonas sp. 8E]|uniref:PTS lactose/cellobiose transporter subunit IIA n=1 Tax=Endozoicomonas sp. 8E TaxID=3035692 RepID=UPI002939485A|nr:PTS lactose/cellobiose transporter subunit IIA [Endozoicomonas sp. 8E]WOG29523.1 PTS lactose/cellobiose transporter subunit IIA [Endozoicomonas sp. 8E]